ncbi:glycosyltransferase family 2 protein [Paenibacillus sp. HN-1]|uniref:glycosyltransferase family A protein n=1 Tax=Paenibacillus TaxID=44249 RepID=UPI001CAA366E|nr:MULTISPECIES: glycosyltransferase family A protein [Paenibacillus]MBY9077617.1 glycosyltransferase family 2 protein [Paenibacillus sp. CGMCC 1.18879]MBY9087993.1 glycosyltransferase family 2 protein [Paenibacillus sinensis]
MITQLIWIGAVYASAVVMVHSLKLLGERGTPGKAGRWMHYILIARNHESVIEGVIRAMTLQSFLTGKRLRVTFLLDEGSSDGTLRIISSLQSSGCSLDLQVRKEAESSFESVTSGYLAAQAQTVIDLRHEDTIHPFSYVRRSESR